MTGSVNTQRFNRLGQYVSSPGNRDYTVTQNSPFSSPAVVVPSPTLIGSYTNLLYPRMDDQAKLAWAVLRTIRKTMFHIPRRCMSETERIRNEAVYTASRIIELR